MVKKAIFLLLSLAFQIVFCLPVAGQSYLINVLDLTTHDGLSHNQAQCVQEDSLGFIWIRAK